MNVPVWFRSFLPVVLLGLQRRWKVGVFVALMAWESQGSVLFGML